MPEITHFPAERALSDGYSSVCHRGGEGLDWARLDTAIRPELLECLRCLPPLLPPSFFFFFFAPVCWWRHSHIWRVSVTGLWQMTDSLKLSWWSPRPLIVLRAVFDLRVMTWSQGLFCFSAQFNPRRPPPPRLWGMHSWLRVDAIPQWHHCSIQIPKLSERSPLQNVLCNYHVQLHSWVKWSWMQESQRLRCHFALKTKKKNWIPWRCSFRWFRTTRLHTPGTSAGQM